MKMKCNLKKFRGFIFAVAVFLLNISLVHSARQPLVSGDSNEWGTVLNQYLNVSLTENGTLIKGVNASFDYFNISKDLIVFGSVNITSGLNVTSGNVLLAITSGNVGIGTTKPDNRLTIIGTDADSYLDPAGILHLNVTDSQNTSVTNMITLDHLLNNPENASARGGVQGGIGLGILFRAVNNDSEIINVSFINASLVNAKNGSEASSLAFYTLTASSGDENRLTPRLILNGSNVFIAPTGGVVGIGTTSPINALTIIGDVSAFGSLNATFINATEIRQGLNQVQTINAVYNLANFTSNYDARSDRFDSANYSSQYASTGYKLSNFTSNYGSEYASTGYKIGNLSSNLAAGSASTIVTSSFTTDNAIVNQNIYIIGNISNTNIANLNINGSMRPALDALFDVGNGTFRWRNANFSGTIQAAIVVGTFAGDGSSITSVQQESPAYKLTNFTSNYDARSDRYGNSNFTTQYDNRNDRFGISNGTALPFSNFILSNLSRIGNADINTSGSLNASGNVTFTQLKNCDTINTDAVGLLTCGTDATGGADSSVFNLGNYSAEYASTGFKRENATDYIGGDNASLLRAINISKDLAKFFSNFGLGNVSNDTLKISGNASIALWNSSGANIFLRDITGNVGIGNSSPDNRLTITGTDIDAGLDPSGLAHLIIKDSFNTSATNIITLDHLLNNPENASARGGVQGGIGLGILFRAVNNNSEIINVSFINASLVNARNGSEASSLAFYTLTASSGDENRLAPRLILNGSDVILAPVSGRVGIGTTSPINALTVIGDVSAFGSLNATFINATEVRQGLNQVQTINAVFNKVNYSAEYDATGFKIANGTALPLSNFQLSNVSNNTLVKGDNASLALWNVASDQIFPRFNRLVNLLKANVSTLNATNVTATNITATRFTGALDCGMLTGGSDGDFCADASGAGESSDPYFNKGNYSLEYASTGYKKANYSAEYDVTGYKKVNFTNEVPLCSGTDKITSSDGNTLTCATDQTGAGGSSKVPREITMWRSDVGATGIVAQGLNLAVAKTLLDATFNGTCRVLDFSNDIGTELACEVQQRTIVVGTGLKINTSIADLSNFTNRRGMVCERTSQGAVIRNDLNMSNGTIPNFKLQWFNKPSYMEGNKTVCVFNEGGNAAADFTFPRVILWHR